MTGDNGTLNNGKSAFAPWAHRARFALTALFFVALPWQTRWIYRTSPIHPDAEWGRLSWYASEMLLGVLLLWAIAHAIWLWRTGRFARQPFTRERWWLVGALAVLAYGVLRAVLSDAPAAGLQHSWWLLEAVLTIVFLQSGWFPWRAAVYGFLIGMTIAALLGIGQVVFQYAPAQKWLGLAEHIPAQGGASVVEYGSTRFLRAYGPFPHPNIFGGYLVAAFLFVILRPRQIGAEGSRTNDGNPPGFFNSYAGLRSFRMTHRVLAILFTVALALTFSRGAWIAWIAVLLAALFVQKNRAFSSVALSVLTMGVVLGALWPVTITRFDRTARLEARAIEERTTSVADGIALWKRTPWFGVGPSQYVNTFFVQHPPSEADFAWWQLAPPHHTGVALLVEYGAVGATLVILTALLFLRSLIKGGEYRPLLWFLPLVALMQFDHYPWSLYSGVMLVALFAGFRTHSIHTISTVDTQIRS